MFIKTTVKTNFDLDDHDKILRIEGPESIHDAISSLMKLNGFECFELEE